MPDRSNTVSPPGEIGRQDLGCSSGAPARRLAACGNPAEPGIEAQHGDAPMHHEIHADCERHPRWPASGFSGRKARGEAPSAASIVIAQGG